MKLILLILTIVIFSINLKAQEKRKFSNLDAALSAPRQEVRYLDLTGFRPQPLSEETIYFQESLIRLSELKVLILDSMGLIGLPYGFDNLQKLDTLFLRGNRISEIELGSIYAKELRYLDLSGNRLNTELNYNGNPREDAIFNLKKLNYLNLSNNEFDDANSLFKNLSNLENLTHLILNKNPLKFVLLEELESLKKLNIVEADSCELSFFSYTKKVSSVKQISLNGNKITVLASFISRFKNIETISLKNNEIYSIHPNFGKLKHLSDLDLANNSLKDLPSFQKLKSLEKLNLSGNQLQTLPPNIEQCKNLQQIWLSGNNIPQTEIEKLQKALPNCKIEY